MADKSFSDQAAAALIQTLIENQVLRLPDLDLCQAFQEPEGHQDVSVWVFAVAKTLRNLNDLLTADDLSAPEDPRGY